MLHTLRNTLTSIPALIVSTLLLPFAYFLMTFPPSSLGILPGLFTLLLTLLPPLLVGYSYYRSNTELHSKAAIALRRTGVGFLCAAFIVVFVTLIWLLAFDYNSVAGLAFEVTRNVLFLVATELFIAYAILAVKQSKSGAHNT